MSRGEVWSRALSSTVSFPPVMKFAMRVLFTFPSRYAKIQSLSFQVLRLWEQRLGVLFQLVTQLQENTLWSQSWFMGTVRFYTGMENIYTLVWILSPTLPYPRSLKRRKSLFREMTDKIGQGAYFLFVWFSKNGFSTQSQIKTDVVHLYDTCICVNSRHPFIVIQTLQISENVAKECSTALTQVCLQQSTRVTQWFASPYKHL